MIPEFKPLTVWKLFAILSDIISNLSLSFAHSLSPPPGWPLRGMLGPAEVICHDPATLWQTGLRRCTMVMESSFSLPLLSFLLLLSLNWLFLHLHEQNIENLKNTWVCKISVFIIYLGIQYHSYFHWLTSFRHILWDLCDKKHISSRNMLLVLV